MTSMEGRGEAEKWRQNARIKGSGAWSLVEQRPLPMPRLFKINSTDDCLATSRWSVDQE